MGTAPDISELIDNKEAWWDSSKRKEYIRREKVCTLIKGKSQQEENRNGLSERAEEFCKELNKNQRRILEANL